MILLEMKCPQLSKPEATAARNQNSIGDNGEKTLGETRLSRGASSPPARRIKFLVVHWFQWSFPDGCLGGEGLTGDLSLGLIYVS